MQLALAKNIQPRPSVRKPKLIVMHEGIQKPDVDSLRGFVRTLSEKVIKSNRTRGKKPAMSREEERFVFQTRDAAVEEREGLKRELKATPLRKRTMGRLNGEIGLMEETIRLADQAVACANQGVLYAIAREVMSGRRTKSSLEDLVAVGNEAMLRHAMGKFDWKTGNRFISYAKFWIRRDMVTEANAQRSDLTVTRNVMDEQHRVSAYVANYLASNGEEPTDRQIAAGSNVSVSRVRKYDMRTGSALSMDTDKDCGMHHKLADKQASFEDRVLRNCEMQRLLSTLPREYQEILVLRHVMGYTVREVAAMKGCWKANIGQKEKRALRRLRDVLEEATSESYSD
jgi:RNA polymerase sigma factor (sigma-70 family)